MGGLLYKDFAAVGGKRILRTLVLLSAGFLLLRMLLPGNAEADVLRISDASGDTGRVVDYLFYLGELSILLIGGFLINRLGAQILQIDERNRIREYVAAMPLGRKTYVTSKYAFVGIAVYALLSLYMIWHIVSLSFMGKGAPMDYSCLTAGAAIPLASLLLLLEAFELPLFLFWGKGTALSVKTAAIMLVGLAVLAFLLFGDLNVFQSLELDTVMRWAEEHTFLVILPSVLSPVIALGIYGLSCRISVCLYERKKASYE